MTREEFDQLSHRCQLELVLLKALYLANRWEQGHSVSLYHIGRPSQGFLVELCSTLRREDAVWVRSLSQGSLLDAYATYVRLPEWQ